VKKLLAVLVVIGIVAAFLGGYWPQRERVGRAEAESRDLRSQLDAARAELARLEAGERLGRLFGQYLALRDAVDEGNFGEAGRLSSPFFDAVQAESERSSDAAVQTALQAILARRDTVTASLARSEPQVSGALDTVERELRRALGYPLPGPAAPSLSPSPAAATPQPESTP
jgi:type II secretory pathway pseudopilin PulG